MILPSEITRFEVSRESKQAQGLCVVLSLLLCVSVVLNIMLAVKLIDVRHALGAAGAVSARYVPGRCYATRNWTEAGSILLRAGRLARE